MRGGGLPIPDLEWVARRAAGHDPAHGTAAFRRLAWTAAAATVALVTLGGVVRITGSGMGCGDDWPLCHGRWIPPLDAPTLIEYGHRLAASLVSVLVLGLLALAWTRHRAVLRLRGPATLAALLLVFQVVLGAVTVWLRLPPASVVLHLATAMVLLAVLVLAALRAGEPAGPSVPTGNREGERGADRRFPSLVRGVALLGFATLLMGGLVANLHAGPACQGFPLCNGTWIPAAQLPVVIHWTHRLLAFTLVALLGVTLVVAWRGLGATRPAAPRARRLSGLAFLLGMAQVAVAGAMIFSFLPPALRAAHLALGTLLWMVLVALVHACPRTAQTLSEAAPASAGRQASHALPSSVPDATRRARRADVPA
jgi:heme A synthase